MSYVFCEGDKCSWLLVIYQITLGPPSFLAFSLCTPGYSSCPVFTGLSCTPMQLMIAPCSIAVVVTIQCTAFFTPFSRWLPPDCGLVSRTLGQGSSNKSQTDSSNQNVCLQNKSRNCFTKGILRAIRIVGIGGKCVSIFLRAIWSQAIKHQLCLIWQIENHNVCSVFAVPLKRLQTPQELSKSKKTGTSHADQKHCRICFCNPDKAGCVFFNPSNSNYHLEEKWRISGLSSFLSFCVRMSSSKICRWHSPECEQVAWVFCFCCSMQLFREKNPKMFTGKSFPQYPTASCRPLSPQGIHTFGEASRYFVQWSWESFVMIAVVLAIAEFVMELDQSSRRTPLLEANPLWQDMYCTVL